MGFHQMLLHTGESIGEQRGRTVASPEPTLQETAPAMNQNPISTGFAASAVNQILATRMIKRPQMRWNRDTVQPFLTVRVAVLNDTLEQAFRSWHTASAPSKGPTPYVA